MKEFYIAPEVEVLCFAPVEELANEFWNTWGLTNEGNGTGQVPGNASGEGIEDGVGGDPSVDGDE